MAESVLTILEQRRLDFTQLASGGSQTFTVLERIDISQFMWGTLELRVHQSDLSGGSISFDVLGDGVTEEDPGIVFATSSPMIASIALQTGPSFSSAGGPMLGDHVMVRVRATKTSTSALSATVSATMVLREDSFSPLEIPSCVLWLDALEASSYVVTPGSPSVVTSIGNLVSGVKWTESSNPPEFEAAGLNGRPCLKGDGSARRLISTDPAVVSAFSGVNRALTIVMATQPISAAPASYMSSFAAANSGVAVNGASFGGRKVTNGRFRLERNSDAGVSIAVDRSVDPALVPQIVTYLTPGATGSIFVNNESTPNPNADNLSNGQVTPNRCALFCYPDSVPDSFSSDRIGAVLVFNTALDAGTRQSVVSWMMGRWGIS